METQWSTYDVGKANHGLYNSLIQIWIDWSRRHGMNKPILGRKYAQREAQQEMGTGAGEILQTETTHTCL